MLATIGHIMQNVRSFLHLPFVYFLLILVIWRPVASYMYGLYRRQGKRILANLVILWFVTMVFDTIVNDVLHLQGVLPVQLGMSLYELGFTFYYMYRYWTQRPRQPRTLNATIHVVYTKEPSE